MISKKVIVIAIFFTIISIFLQNKFNKKQELISPYITYSNLIPNTYRIGFTNLDSEIQINNLEITGKIPTWIRGTLLRNGPAKFHINSSEKHKEAGANSWVLSWFDGLAMIHAFKINNGKVSYANKFLKTTNYYDTFKLGNMRYAGFVQPAEWGIMPTQYDPCKSIFKQLFAFFIPSIGELPEIPNANVNIAKYADKFLAFTEIPLPVEFDPETLNTIGKFNVDDKLPKTSMQDTAHPHYDAIAKAHIAYFTKFGLKSNLNLYKVSDNCTHDRKVIASIEVKEPSYMHSFAITEHYAILSAIPFVVNPISLIFSRKAFIKNYKWKPELDTNFIVIDRINNKVIGSYKAEPFFAFHHVNAFEGARPSENKIFVDIVTYPDTTIFDSADIDFVLSPITIKQNLNTVLKRFTIDLKNNSVSSQILSTEHLELPRINYEKYNTKEYNYIYAYAASNTQNIPNIVADKLIKINIKTGQVLHWSQENCFPGEPVFIAHPNGITEDDGVVMSVILDTVGGALKTSKSFLLILDASTFKEIARAQLPHHIPYGIHGQFFE